LTADPDPYGAHLPAQPGFLVQPLHEALGVEPQLVGQSRVAGGYGKSRATNLDRFATGGQGLSDNLPEGYAEPMLCQLGRSRLP
jgi:hypothetical protein